MLRIIVADTKLVYTFTYNNNQSWWSGSFDSVIVCGYRQHVLNRVWHIDHKVLIYELEDMDVHNNDKLTIVKSYLLQHGWKEE